MNDRRTALITGGARRVGRAIAQRLGQAGFDILITYHTSGADAGSLAAELRAAGAKCDVLQIDLEAPDAVSRIVAWTKSAGSRLDVLVNNASLYLPDTAAERSTLHRRHQRLNVEVPLELAYELSAGLRATRGQVINMLDLLATRPMPSYSIYSASKAALLNATRSLARELAPEVTVNGISPGVVAWPEDMPLDEREKYLLKVPLRRAGTPVDVANLVHFLVTDGTYITGQNIVLDGGRSIV
jgi:pteridine reductase